MPDGRSTKIIRQCLSRWYPRLAGSIVATIALTFAADADAPLPPQQDVDVRSPNGECVAHASLGEAQIIGFRLADGRERLLWSVAGYQRYFAISDDCGTLVVIYGGFNLLKLEDRRPSTVVLTFYKS